MSVTSAIRKMLDQGLTIEQALIAAEAFESEPPQPTARQARNRRYYENKQRLKASELDAQDVPLSPKKEIPPTPPKEKTTPIPVLSVCEAGAREFEQFWSIYPNKVGKRDALKAFERAGARADLETIMAGLRRYTAKTDDRPWCNPATWLNQDRWTDDPVAVVPFRRSTSPPKPKTIGDMFREDAKRMGIIPNDDLTGTENGRMDSGIADGQGGGTGIARRFTVSGDILGKLG